jgi:hypothetical protein
MEFLLEMYQAAAAAAFCYCFFFFIFFVSFCFFPALLLLPPTLSSFFFSVPREVPLAACFYQTTRLQLGLSKWEVIQRIAGGKGLLGCWARWACWPAALLSFPFFSFALLCCQLSFYFIKTPT